MTVFNDFEMSEEFDELYEGADPAEIAIEFYDPGGRSALRAGVREHSCPTCGRKNQLTSKDVEQGYQCDRCADIAEGRIGSWEY